jgi:sugar phosphate isomerase/epimerase
MKPKIAVFPKCYMDELCVHHTMTLCEWIEIAATLEVDGVEFYSGFIEDSEAFLKEAKAFLERHRLQMPMLCCSPDFTQTDPDLLQEEIDREIRMIEITASFGISQVVRVIKSLLPVAEQYGVVLTMENHYKDNYWQYPEFAQKMEIFTAIISQIDSPWFGVNYDPSNALLAGENPLELLERVKYRVASMHASDRYLKTGTLDDLRREENSAGYAARLAHGVIGRGLNDYDRIFSTLNSVRFSSWISIEDGMNGIEDLRESVRFLKTKIDLHFTE